MTTKPFDLTGKVAIVTGGNGGIGLGMARGLAGAGSDIAIVDAMKRSRMRRSLSFVRAASGSYPSSPT
jgi:NAD(P)-dependent dehydrogenase (short-subunit alcohol dehydrogenase family)